MRSIQYARSSTRLVSGLVVLLVGQFLFESGQRQALEAALRTYSSGGDGAALTAIGAIASLVGLIVLLLGVSQLATNVDMAAKVAADVLGADEAARVRAIREQQQG